MKNNMEMCIMACLLEKPDLMNQVYVKDKHFLKHRRLWKFMCEFYSKFKMFDINIMYSVCKDKWHIMNYIEELVYVDALPCYFNQYQDRLIEIYEENEREKYIRDEICNYSLKLMVGKITTKDFRRKVDEIFDFAEKLYKEEEKSDE